MPVKKNENFLIFLPAKISKKANLDTSSIKKVCFYLFKFQISDSCATCQCSLDLSLPPVKISAGDENFYFCEVFYSRAENGKIIEAKNISRFPENGVLTINGILQRPKNTSTYAAVNFGFVKIIYISHMI